MFPFNFLFPYSNQYTLNLDWMLSKVAQVENVGPEISEAVKTAAESAAIASNAAYSVLSTPRGGVGASYVHRYNTAFTEGHPADLPGWINRQGRDQYNGVVYECINVGAGGILAYNLHTGALVGDWRDVGTGHGGCCQFNGEERADPTDPLPLFYVCDAEDPLTVKVMRYDGNAWSIYKTIRFPGTIHTEGVPAGSLFYTFGLSEGHNQGDMVITTWDLSRMTESGGVFVPAKIRAVTLPPFYDHQDAIFYKGRVWWVCGYPNPSTPRELVVYDPQTENYEARFAIPFIGEGLSLTEPEGIFFATDAAGREVCFVGAGDVETAWYLSEPVSLTDLSPNIQYANEGTRHAVKFGRFHVEWGYLQADADTLPFTTHGPTSGPAFYYSDPIAIDFLLPIVNAQRVSVVCNSGTVNYSVNSIARVATVHNPGEGHANGWVELVIYANQQDKRPDKVFYAVLAMDG